MMGSFKRYESWASTAHAGAMLRDGAPVKMGSGGKGSRLINTLKDEQGQGHTVLLGKCVHLYLAMIWTCGWKVMSL